MIKIQQNISEICDSISKASKMMCWDECTSEAIPVRKKWEKDRADFEADLAALSSLSNKKQTKNMRDKELLVLNKLFEKADNICKFGGWDNLHKEAGEIYRALNRICDAFGIPVV